MQLLDSVLRTIRRYRLLHDGRRVLCALSGGADSVALLHILLELQQQGQIELAGVAHFNHALRGAEADADEEFCRSLAAALEVTFDAGRGNVAQRARVEKRSVEDAARAARYEFLREAAERLSANAIAVAHTLDDQAETFLMRVIRGAGTRGLGGIRPRAGNIIRPLIEVRRSDLRAYATERRLAHREDASNLDVDIARNRIRHELIPYLERDFSPGIVEVLAREAATAQEDEDRLHAEAIDLSAAIVLSSAPLTLDANAFRRLHPALAARVARLALGHLAGGRFVGFDHLRRFGEFVREAADGSAVSLPGQQAVRKGNEIILRPEPPRTGKAARVSNQMTQVPGAAVSRLPGDR